MEDVVFIWKDGVVYNGVGSSLYIGSLPVGYISCNMPRRPDWSAWCHIQIVGPNKLTELFDTEAAARVWLEQKAHAIWQALHTPTEGRQADYSQYQSDWLKRLEEQEAFCNKQLMIGAVSLGDQKLFRYIVDYLIDLGFSFGGSALTLEHMVLTLWRDHLRQRKTIAGLSAALWPKGDRHGTVD